MPAQYVKSYLCGMVFRSYFEKLIQPERLAEVKRRAMIALVVIDGGCTTGFVAM